MEVGIAGAGFSGAVTARELAQAGHRVVVHESADHVAGNCFTERDPDTGILLHRFGPHVFHTNDGDVWRYVQRFGEFVPYRHRVRTTVDGTVYSMPINLLTINHVFGTCLGPDEARAFVAERVDPTAEQGKNFEQQALSTIGRELYEKFFAGYTKKQWGLDPARLPASVMSRLPLRFDYDDSYFDDEFQGLPRHGYTPIVEAILDHPAIDVRLGSDFGPQMAPEYDHCVWTGPLDAWFGFRFGRLGYRTLDFETRRCRGDHLGCAVMNFGDEDVPYTRITDHKHLSPWEDHHEHSVHTHEFSRLAAAEDRPYYPIRLANDKALLDTYLDAARRETAVSFVGRLGTYRYLDMDDAIGEALRFSSDMLRAVTERHPIPLFAGDAF